MASPYKRRTTDNSLGERVSALEQAVEHIDSAMLDMRHSMTDGFRQLAEKIDAQSERAKPHVLGWAGWAAVLLILLGMIGNGYVRDIERIERAVLALEQSGHSAQDPVQDKELADLNIRLNELKSSTLREIDQKYNTVRSRVEELEGTVERERARLTEFKEDILIDVSKNTAFIAALRKK